MVFSNNKNIRGFGALRAYFCRAFVMALVNLVAFSAQALVGGITVDGIFPASIRYQLSRDRLCSGVVLDHQHILTAAHCLGEFNGTFWSGFSLFFAPGSMARVSRWSENAELMRVKNFYIHPSVQNKRALINFSSEQNFESTFDLAIIEFEKALPYNVFATWAPQYPQMRQIIRYGGYGETSLNRSNFSAHLNMAAAAIFDQSDTHFFAEGSSGTSMLGHGDSGGPVYNAQGQVIGINSIIKPLRTSSVPTIGDHYITRIDSYSMGFTKVRSALGWISQVLAHR